MKKGSTVSIETRQKISNTLRGRKLSPQHVENVRKALSGRKLSDAHIKKMSELRMGDKNPRWKGGNSYNYIKRLAMPDYKSKNCELCGVVGKKMYFDHNHKTNKFRGWLCTRCNTTIGLVKEDIKILMAMVEYINKHNA